MTAIPSRGPQLASVRESFSATFGAYVPPDWTLDAECSRFDPEVFYPRKGGSKKEEKALAVCRSCIVREQCLAEALEYESGAIDTGDTTRGRADSYGVRGGLRAAQRKALIRKAKVKELAAKRKLVVADYKAGKLTVDEIAEKHSCGASSVHKWAKAAGAPMRPQAGPATRKQRQDGAA